MREPLETLETPGAEAAALLIPLAYLAGLSVRHDAAERHAAIRRAELLLAAGGDPRRPLDPDGRAVTALAADLDSPQSRRELATGLDAVAAHAEGLPVGGLPLRSLLGDGELAWRCYASAILVDALAEE